MDTVGVSAEEGDVGDVDWDRPTGLLGWWVNTCHDHYYITLAGWLVFVFLLTALVMVLPADGRCIAGAPPMQIQVRANCRPMLPRIHNPHQPSEWEKNASINSLDPY